MCGGVETHATVPSNCSWLTFIESLLCSWHYFECFTCINSFMPLPRFTVEGHRGTVSFISRSLFAIYHILLLVFLASPSTGPSEARTMSGTALYPWSTTGSWQNRTSLLCGRALVRQQGSSPICSPGRSSVNTVVLLSK